jgi:hypothetical protein
MKRFLAFLPLKQPDDIECRFATSPTNQRPGVLPSAANRNRFVRPLAAQQRNLHPQGNVCPQRRLVAPDLCDDDSTTSTYDFCLEKSINPSLILSF